MPNPVVVHGNALSAAASGTSGTVLTNDAGTTGQGILQLVWIYVKITGQTFSVTGGDPAVIVSQGSDANQSWAVASIICPDPVQGGVTFSWQSSASWVGGAVAIVGGLGATDGIGWVGSIATNSGTGTTATLPSITMKCDQSLAIGITVSGGGAIPTLPTGWTSWESIAGANESCNIISNNSFNTSGSTTGTHAQTVVTPWVAITLEILGRNVADKLTFPHLRPHHPLAQGLICALPFYDVGNDFNVGVNDVSGYQPQAYKQSSNTGTGGFWRDGPFGSAYNFGFNGSATSFAIGPKRFEGLNQFGAVARFNSGTGRISNIFSKNGTTGVKLWLDNVSNKLNFALNGITLVSTNTLTTFAWNTAGCAYDGNTISVVLNGVVTTTTHAGLAVPADGINCFVGSDGTTNAQMMLDCLYIYNRPLSASEIMQIGADPGQMFKRQNVFNFGVLRASLPINPVLVRRMKTRNYIDHRIY